MDMTENSVSALHLIFNNTNEQKELSDIDASKMPRLERDDMNPLWAELPQITNERKVIAFHRGRNTRR